MKPDPIADLRATNDADAPVGFWAEHRFLLLIMLTIVISFVLVCISLYMYTASGAIQLDLSRPGYQSVSDQVERENPITAFGATGPVTTETIDEFLTLYDEQIEKAKSVDAYNGDPLNPELIEFSDES